MSGELTDEQINADLALYGFDPYEPWPEHSHRALIEAYRAGWEANTGRTCNGCAADEKAASA